MLIVIQAERRRKEIEKKKKKKKKKKSFGIYWEGDDTFDLKVPRVVNRTASGGVRSSP